MMETISYSQVQDLVQHLPPQCLPAAYDMLRELTDHSASLQSQVDFMRLPRASRNEVLASQADEMMTHYAQSASEREDWQAGDFTNEGSAG
jgi:hypothetical protein